MKHLSKEACDRIREILEESRRKCGRTILEVCVYADFSTRNNYYNVTHGESRDPIINILIGIGANVPVTLFPEYLEAANIIMSPKFSERNRRFWEYLEKHSSPKKTDYDIDDLNDYLDYY